MSKKKKLLLKYGIGAVLTGAAVVWIALTRDMSEGGLRGIFRAWSDGFFLPGVLLIFAGLLIALANEGSFNGISYVLRNVVGRLVPGNRIPYESYKEYTQRKSDNKTTGYSFVFVLGAVCVAVSLVFLWLYYQAA